MTAGSSSTKRTLLASKLAFGVGKVEQRALRGVRLWQSAMKIIR